MKFGKHLELSDRGVLIRRLIGKKEIPLGNIMWVYHRVQNVGSGSRSAGVHSAVLVDDRKKVYQIMMKPEEVSAFLKALHHSAPDVYIGIPKGADLKLSSLPNTRDLGGMMTTDGHRILPGRLYRSGAIETISPQDRQRLLQQYHLKTVIDLRTEDEKGIEHGWREELSVVDLPVCPMNFLKNKNSEKNEEWILKQINQGDRILADEKRIWYRSMISSPEVKKQFAEFFRILERSGEGAVLWQDEFGTDRAGVITMLLLEVLGVPEEQIREDYLRSNSYTEEVKEAFLGRYRGILGAKKSVMEQLEGLVTVDASEADCVYDEIKKSYGTVENYLVNEIALTEDVMQTLRNRYLI